MTTVSVVVPVYNVRPYLERCVESLLAQTHHAVEIILVDDGSSDGSSTICAAYERECENVQTIRKQNGGLSDARNVGLTRARGDFVVFLDSDDWMDPEGIEGLTKAALASKQTWLSLATTSMWRTRQPK